MPEGGDLAGPRPDASGERGGEELLPRTFVGAVAVAMSVALFALGAMGPLWLGWIQYRTSQSSLWQIMGADVVNMAFIAPVLMVGGVLHLMGRPGSKYLLILTPVTLMYTGLSLGIGQEWSDPSYTGNVERFSWLLLALVVGGLLLLVASLSMFTGADAPDFRPRGLRAYVGVMSLFLLMFAAMWLSELVQVVRTGDAAGGAYKETPTVWWTIRYLDLGFTIPLGFLGLFLLLTRPRRAYSLVLLFFGFFVTMGSAVLSMGVVMTLNHDPQVQPGALPIFGVLALLSYVGLLYLVRDKLPRRASSRPDVTGRARESSRLVGEE